MKGEPSGSPKWSDQGKILFVFLKSLNYIHTSGLIWVISSGSTSTLIIFKTKLYEIAVSLLFWLTMGWNLYIYRAWSMVLCSVLSLGISSSVSKIIVTLMFKTYSLWFAVLCCVVPSYHTHREWEKTRVVLISTTLYINEQSPMFSVSSIMFW